MPDQLVETIQALTCGEHSNGLACGSDITLLEALSMGGLIVFVGMVIIGIMWKDTEPMDRG